MATTTFSWQPTASFANLQARANMLAKLRQFFAERNILEVETPLLCQHTVTDKHIESFLIKSPGEANNPAQTYYLQTSPEYAMKRLLAAGSGPIFQITKAFRQGEVGRFHNPEFSMLEWYRPSFNHHELMDEVDLLLQFLFNCSPAKRSSYQQLFINVIDIDPLQCQLNDLHEFLKTQHITDEKQIKKFDKDTALQLILSHVIEPNLGKQAPIFIYDFPSSQAALAKIRYDNPPVAERFEAYFQGIEIANGFHELIDANEQQHRFQQDQLWRKANNRTVPPIDKYLLAALQSGLPNCAGVAMGIDRLLMLFLKTTLLQDVIAFNWENA